MALSQRLEEIRSGFEPAFWVANLSELFERLAYYGAFASLANYLHETLQFSIAQTGSLTGFFGGLVWFLAILGGALADRLGFRRALSLAYLILTCAYFLLGSVGAPWMSSVRGLVPLSWLVLFVLMLPALGIALVKPCVVGTTARASKENVRSIGFSIYYTIVNIGGALGPYVASITHRKVGVEGVFRISALCVFVMFFAVLLFFKEPRSSGQMPTPGLAEVAKNFFTVISNWRFMLFLLIFSGYWVVFWQQYISLPLYIHSAVNRDADVEMILVTDGATVIFLQVLISYLTGKIPAFRAVTLGTLVSSLSWIIVAAHPAVWTAVLSLFVLALGEMTQAPRYYEYVSRLAPPEQQGIYMGFAFLPIGIGSFLAGRIGGSLLGYFGEVQHRPERFWWTVSAIGIATALCLEIYDRVLKPGAVSPANSAPNS